jgi:hypothetical protein
MVLLWYNDNMMVDIIYTCISNRILGSPWEYIMIIGSFSDGFLGWFLVLFFGLFLYYL